MQKHCWKPIEMIECHEEVGHEENKMIWIMTLVRIKCWILTNYVNFIIFFFRICLHALMFTLGIHINIKSTQNFYVALLMTFTVFKIISHCMKIIAKLKRLSLFLFGEIAILVIWFLWVVLKHKIILNHSMNISYLLSQQNISRIT